MSSRLTSPYLHVEDTDEGRRATNFFLLTQHTAHVQSFSRFTDFVQRFARLSWKALFSPQLPSHAILQMFAEASGVAKEKEKEKEREKEKRGVREEERREGEQLVFEGLHRGVDCVFSHPQFSYDR